MTHAGLPYLTPIKSPFALNGQEKQFCDVASFSNGFEAAFSQKPGQQGGCKYISRPLINKLFNQISGAQFLNQIGHVETFDPAVCSAIGGYPEDAILKWVHDGEIYDLKSLVDNNFNDFRDTGPDNIHWTICGSSNFSFIFPDYGTKNFLKTWSLGGSTSVYGGLAKNKQSATDEYIATKTGWIFQTMTFPENTSSMLNFEAAVVYYGNDTSTPSTLDDIYQNYKYSWLEIFETISFVFAMIPVVAGTKMTAGFTCTDSGSYQGPESFTVSIYDISPAR